MVLSIENRTENWRTARYLWPFCGERAIRLACRLGEPQNTPAADVKLELYWKGVRDWCAGRNKAQCEERLVESCRQQFQDLRQRIGRYGHFRPLRDGEGNYAISSEEHRTKLVTNMLNTEIDIVLESPTRLYIGEAKSESSFHASGRLVLVHQLIRQYVMAKVLVDVTGSGREVVPFVVLDGTRGRLSHQVRFMVAQGWMRSENCLIWDTLQELARERGIVHP